MNFLEKWKESWKEEDERNIRSWKERPRANKWTTVVFVGFMLITATALIVTMLFDVIVYKTPTSLAIVEIIYSAIIYGFVIWYLKYEKKIIAKAFPRNSKYHNER